MLLLNILHNWNILCETFHTEQHIEELTKLCRTLLI